MQKNQSGNRAQSELETIIRASNFTSQSDANASLQKHGLSCQLREDGTAEIFEGVSGDNQRSLATVQFNGQQTPRQITGINY